MNQALGKLLTRLKQYFVYAAVFSAGVNLLMLVPIIYMLQIYDRVISSGSLSTLTMLTLILVALLCAMGALEWVRSLIMVGASGRIDKELRSEVSSASLSRALKSGGESANAGAYYDVAGLRQFLTGPGLFAFFDAPWFPIYVGIMFLFHPWFGVMALLAGVIMMVLAYLNERSTNELMQSANQQTNAALTQVNDGLRNAEVVVAMGMARGLGKHQDAALDEGIGLQAEASRRASLWSSASKTVRIVMQSLILGLGAYLAIQQQISPGMMIAGSLLLGRALAPIDQLVAAWKGFSVARVQYERLSQLFESNQPLVDPMPLPEPAGNLQAENIVVVAPTLDPKQKRVPVLSGVNLSFNAGEAIGIVGPSASGKSSLIRTLLGLWRPASGVVRLDGADISQWAREDLGPHVGYLPQDIELFNGSIAQNIARFGESEPDRIVSAAKFAGVHDLILRLPQGYDTEIGGNGLTLSGGQRQSVALARAVFGQPSLIVLDEPNSNLDDQGERELIATIRRIRESGATQVIVTHRLSLLSGVDRIAVLKDGKVVAFGEAGQILSQLTGGNVTRSVTSANSFTPKKGGS